MTELKSAVQWQNEACQYATQFEFIKAIQRNAIEAALELAETEAVVEQAWNNMGELTGQYRVAYKSITSLINHEKLKV